MPVAFANGTFVLAATSTGDLLGGLCNGVGAVVGISEALRYLEDFIYQQKGGGAQLGHVNLVHKKV